MSHTTERSSHLLLSGSVIALGLCVAPPALLAQSPGDSERADSSPLEVITVTARKREENVLEVPLSLTTFSADDISNRHLQSVTELSRLTPNFTYVDLGQRYIDAPTIRGITSDLLDNTRQAASFFVDGVYVTGSISTLGFSDIERIEVLRGPQSTLFGRATFSGAINYVTKNPTDEFEGSVNVSGASDDEYELAASISGPIGDGDLARFRLGARYYGYGSEWSSVTVDPGEDLGAQESTSVTGALYLTPTDQLDIVARVAYTEDEDELAATLLIGTEFHNCGPAFGDTVPATNYICGEIDFDESLLGLNVDEMPDPGLRRDLLRTSLSATWSNDEVTLTSITAFNDETSDRSFDIDFEPVKIFVFGGVDTAQVNNYRDYRDFSQELRLQSADDGPLQWLIGGYYLDFEQQTGRDFPGPSAFEPERERNEEITAVFGSIEYAFTDTLTVTAEGRYQESDIEVLDPATGQPLVIDNAGGVSRKTFDAFLPRLSVRYAISDNVNLYGYWAEGNRPGGFNTSPALPPELAVFDEEEIETVEFGAKFTSGGGTIVGEAAIFFSDVPNLTTRSTFEPPSGIPVSFLEDAGSQTVRGLELSLQFLPTDQASFGFNVGYVDSELDEGVTISSSRLLGTTDPTAVSGNRPAQVPEWTGALFGRYEWPTTFYDLGAYIDGDLSYRSSLYADEANLAETGDSTRVNMRIGLQNEQWRVELFGKNIFEDETPIRVSNLTQFSTFGQGVQITPSRGRQIGIRTTFDF